MLRLYFLVAVVILLVACGVNDFKESEAPVVRYGMVTGLKPEMISKYKALHQEPWPAVLKKIKECHIRNYSIFLKEIESRYYLFSYFEYTGNDFSADMRKMAADTTTQRWWRETDPCQWPLKEALEKHQVWAGAEEVFHLQ